MHGRSKRSDNPERRPAGWLPAFALACAVACAGVISATATPAALLPDPERPRLGDGDTVVHVEGTAYPRAATGSDGVRVTIASPALRIVSQHASIDEFLYAIVPAQRIAGVSENAYLRRTSRVISFAERFSPIIASEPERVLRAHPDLVLTPASARAEVAAILRHSGLVVYRMHTMFESLASIEEHIRLIGYLTDEDNAAGAELAKFQRVVAAAAARRPASTPPVRVMGYGGAYSYGSMTLFHDILRTLGAENVAATAGFVGYDRVTNEDIVRWNPDWIVAGAEPGGVQTTRSHLMAHPAMSMTTAARRGQILVLEYPVFLAMSPFTAELVDAMSRAFYGEGRS